MAIDLSPETEDRVRRSAENAGISCEEMLLRMLANSGTPLSTADMAGSDPVLNFLNERLKQGEAATSQQVRDADIKWRQFKKQINENRHINEEPDVYGQESY